MTTHIAFLLYCILLLGIVVLVKVEHRQQSVPVVQAAAPANVVPWRLFTVCNPDRRNVPFIKPGEAV